jgi:hypothetical protein
MIVMMMLIVMMMMIAMVYEFFSHVVVPSIDSITVRSKFEFN